MTRYAITHVDKKLGLRRLTHANQGRNHFLTQQEAQEHLDAIRDSLRDKVLGDEADSLKVTPIDCYDHGDAKSHYYGEE